MKFHYFLSIDDETEDAPPSELSAAGGLGTLMASYGADSDEDEKEDVEKSASNKGMVIFLKYEQPVRKQKMMTLTV